MLAFFAACVGDAEAVAHAIPAPGFALRFDGPASTHPGPGLVELPLLHGGSNSTITISVWARIEKHKTHNLLATSGSREAGWALFVDKGEQAIFGLWQHRSLQTVSTRPLQQGTAWHFISGTYDGQALRVWVDTDMGEEVPLPRAHLDTPWEGATLGGAADWPQLRMHGDIGPVTIWAEARSGEQLARDMMGVPDPGPTRPVARWEMRAPVTPGILPDAGRAGLNASFSLEGGPVVVSGGYPGFVTGELPLAEEQRRGLSLTLAPGHEAKLRLAETPSGLEGRLVVEDPHRHTSLGEPPELPWPLVPARTYTFYPNASHAAVNLREAGVHCAKFVLRSDAGPGSPSFHDVNILGVTSQDFSFVQRAKLCKRSRFDKNIVLPAEVRQGHTLAASVVVALGDLAVGIAESWQPFFKALEAAVESSEALLEVIVVGWGAPSVPLPWRVLQRTRVVLVHEGATAGEMLNVAVGAARAEWVVAGQPGWTPAGTFVSEFAAAVAQKGDTQVLLLHPPGSEGLSAGVEECHVSPRLGRDHVEAAPQNCQQLTRRSVARVLAGALGDTSLWPAFLGSELFFRRKLGIRAGFPTDGSDGPLAVWSMLAAGADRGLITASQVAALEPRRDNPKKKSGRVSTSPPHSPPPPLIHGASRTGLAPTAAALRRAAAQEL